MKITDGLNDNNKLFRLILKLEEKEEARYYSTLIRPDKEVIISKDCLYSLLIEVYAARGGTGFYLDRSVN